MNKPILYGAPLSPFVRKVAVFLYEKGGDFEWLPVRPHDRLEAFARLSPLGAIPAYQDSRAGIADSSVICAYLEKIHPNPPLFPADPVDYARALWFEEYFDGAMIAPMRALYFERWFNPLVHSKPADSALVKTLGDQAEAHLAYLESEIAGKEWMAGGMFSIADISLAGGFLNMRLFDQTIDRARYPQFAAYVERALARPSFRKCDAFMQAFIGKMKEKLAQKHQ